ncbi:MAG: methyltransferase domain-containing protein [Chloroflexota bacterium]|nr:methyltransferase domain-containing protein [Chloroflexota bacterium]
MECIEDILICPKTRNRISFDFANSEVKVKKTDISYPIKNGIIDFLPGVDDDISKAYDSRASFYSNYVTSSNIFTKLLNLVFWGVASQYEFAQEILPFIPEDFDGILLDVPVGTGILTLEKYRKLQGARIIAVDYSLGMLVRAKQLYAKNGIKNVTLVRGDVGNLPIDDAKVDLCLSMNGFHAFSEKDIALREIRRVLKSKGQFVGCFYICGKRRFTDFYVQNRLAKGGSFTAPFYDEVEALARFGEYFNINSKTNLKSYFHFDMEKK